MKLSKGAFVITGAGRGLGKVLALKAYSEGFPVALISRTEKDLNNVKGALQNAGNSDAKVTTHVLDLTDSKATDSTFSQIIHEHGHIDTLVNNAGTWTGGKQVLEMDADFLRRSLDLNLFSAFNTIKAVLSSRDSNSQTTLKIMNIGATAAFRGGKGMAAFSIAKTGLLRLSESLAKEQGPLGVHVAYFNIDGLIDNERTRKLNPDRPDDRYMKPESIADEILRVAMQPKDCWTFLWEARTHNAEW